MLLRESGAGNEHYRKGNGGGNGGAAKFDHL
jgi:hypothetical protein